MSVTLIRAMLVVPAPSSDRQPIGAVAAPEPLSNTSGPTATGRGTLAGYRRRAARQPAQGCPMSMMLMLKYGLGALLAGLWSYGLIEQLGSSQSTATYLAISALLVGISRL